jgi:O-antigen ligase
MTSKVVQLPLGAVSELRGHVTSLGPGGLAAAGVGAAVVAALAALEGLEVAGLALLAGGALVVGLYWPVALPALVVLALPAGERAAVLGAQVAPLEAVVGGGALGYVLHHAVRRLRPRLDAAHWAFAVLVVAMALSTLGPVDDSDRGREALLWSALGIVFSAATTYAPRPGPRRLLLGSLVVATAVEAGVALYEYLDRWSDRFSVLGGAIVYPLPEGTLGHPNALAQFLVLSVLTVLALGLGERGAVRHAAVVVAVAGSFALVVTFSRASWIAFVAGCVVYVLERRARVWLLVGGVAAVVAGAALAVLDTGAVGARISSLFSGRLGGLTDFRIELARRAGRIAADHPFTGSGHFEEVGVYAGRPDLATHPHNLFLGLAVFFGIPAAFAFGALVLVALGRSWQRLRVAPERDRLTPVGILAVLVALLVNGLFEYPFWNVSLTVLIVLILALAVTSGARPRPGS